MNNSTALPTSALTTTNIYPPHDEDEEGYHHGFVIKYDLPAIFIGFLIIVLNSAVLLLVAKRKQLRTQANYLLCSLAVSDLLNGLVNIPLYLICTITYHGTVCAVAEVLLRMSSISTILHLLAVSVDRFIAAKHALSYPRLMSSFRSHVLKVLIWTVAIIVAFIQYSWMKSSDYVDHEIPYDIANLVIFFALPLIIMIALYSMLLKDYIWLASRQRRCQPIRNDLKTAIVFVVMFVAYCVCWLPYFLVRLQHNIGDGFFVLPHTLEYAFVYLRFINPILNPCIYVFGKHDFWKVLNGLFSRESSETNDGNSGVETTFQHLTSV